MTAPYTLLKAWNLKARKAFGQNFLKDPSTAADIVSLARIGQDETVVEIGAGLGIMTAAAARKSGRLVAVEKDHNLIPLLRSELLLKGLDRVQIVEQDVLKLDYTAFADEASQLVVIGNLPYNISSQVVVGLVRQRRVINRAVLMFQKELAQRLCASCGTKAYGRLSVILQYCADLKVLRELKADQFYPKPKVDSVILSMTFKPRIDVTATDELFFARVVQAAFGQRRKTLRNALAGGFLPLDNQQASVVLEAVASIRAAGRKRSA